MGQAVSVDLHVTGYDVILPDGRCYYVGRIPGHARPVLVELTHGPKRRGTVIATFISDAAAIGWVRQWEEESDAGR